MEPGLEFGSVVGLDYLDREPEPLSDVVQELDRCALIRLRVNRPETFL